MTKLFATVLFIVLGAACGDNADRPDAGGADSSIDAPPGSARAVIVAGDFVTPGPTGVMSSLDLDTMTMTQNVAAAGAISNDPVLRKIGNDLLVVNRSGNNVTILDAQTFMVKDQISTGASSNPQDVATFGSKLFLPALGTAGVVVATRGETPTTTIDLSALDPDGKPDCISAYRVGNDIYVACGLLDQNFTARGNGKVVVIDAPSSTVRATLTLSTANPFGAFTELPDNAGLVIPTFDYMAPTTRCLERVLAVASPVAMGCLVQHSAVGGYIVRTAIQKIDSSQMLWMIVNNGNFAAEKARLWGYDLTTSTLWSDPLTPETQVLTDMAVCPNGKMVVADKTMAANGLRVYQGAQEQTTNVLPVGLRPQSSPALVCY